MARRARSSSRSRRNRRNEQEGGRQLNVPLIAGVALFGVLLGLLVWAWLFFDQDAYEEARRPPVVMLEVPPPQMAEMPAEDDPGDGEEDFEDEDDELAEDAGQSEGAAQTSDSASAVPMEPDGEDASAGSEGTSEQPEAAQAPPPLPEEEEVALAPAPQPDLVTEGPEGPLPVVAPDGRMAWQVYARPFQAPDPKTPKIAIVIAGLGLSQAATEAAIQQLPGAVTLAFVPYARGLGEWIAQARAAGHEVLLELPMEPFDYPKNDPGPHTLLTTLDADENIARLDWLLSRFTGYVGVTNFMGEKFTASEDAMEPVLTELGDRGLLYLDSKASRNSVASDLAAELELPNVASNRFIDRVASRVAIDARLFELERIAKSAGSAVGVGFPYPVTIERVSQWARALRQKRYLLAPLSAVVESGDG